MTNSVVRMMHLLDEKGVKQRRAGVVWRDLRVSGTGSALQLQATVGSMLMAPFRIGEVFGSQPEKIILNDFEGCLKSGEMLVVLGRPGSGCKNTISSASSNHLLTIIARFDFPENHHRRTPEPEDEQGLGDPLQRHSARDDVETVQRRGGLQPGS